MPLLKKSDISNEKESQELKIMSSDILTHSQKKTLEHDEVFHCHIKSNQESFCKFRFCGVIVPDCRR